MNGRVLVIGLDGATARLLEPWMRAGELPELARLRERGVHGELRSTFPPLTPPAWSSFMTGKNPGKHGVFGFRRLAAMGYRSGDLVTARDLRARTLWEILSDAGRTAGAINVPPAYPLRPVNGFLVSCLLTPLGERDVVHPPELRRLLPEGYQIAVDPPARLVGSDADYRARALAYLRQLDTLAAQRTELALRLVRECPCDLVAVVFYEPDRIQHFFWTHLAGGHPPGVGAETAAEIAGAARAIFHRIDGAIGALVRATGPDTTTFVISDHGFGEAPARLVYVNRWLADAGWLRVRASWRWRRRLVRRLPGGLRERWRPTDEAVDWPRTRAWCEVIETRSAGVWLNVRGRQPAGCVDPGAEYERVREELRRGLLGLHDGGGRVFETVARREDVYSGPETAAAPDLLLYTGPRHGLRFNGLRPELRARDPFDAASDDGLTGAHDPAGIYLIAGPTIAARGAAGVVPIEAIAPTALYLLDLPIPDGMDAAPLLDLVDPALRTGRPVRREPDRDPAPLDDAPPWRSDADRAVVEAQLRALGYVE
jgi:predicted AlkP superfamily phosphohydrolase/phosphomutase